MPAEILTPDADVNRTTGNSEKILPQFLILFFFVATASYLVLHHEYHEGAFLYYFPKAKFYYANHNKIIFPVYFWALFILTTAALHLLRGEMPGTNQILDFSRYALCFHIYLLLLTHSREITPGFTLVPTRMAPLPNVTLYENTFMTIGFVAYYCMTIGSAVKLCNGKGNIWESILPISIFVPYFFLESPWLHLVCLGISILVCCIAQNTEKLLQASRAGLSAKWVAPALIFTAGLCFRFWYAGYLAAFGEGAADFSADGPAYFKSAMAFSEGAIEKVDFWHAPFYALYLSAFLAMIGRSPDVAVFSQAVVGAFAPVLVYYLAKRLGGGKTAFIAGLLTATSHLCIHFSAIIHRANLLQVVFPAMVLIVVSLTESTTLLAYLTLGLLFGVAFYCGQEMFPALLALSIALAFSLARTGLNARRIAKNFLGIAAGVVLAIAPLNLFYFQQTGKLIPLGRDPAYIQQGELVDSWTFGKSAAAYELTQKYECNPLSNLKDCLGAFLDAPLTISKLFIEKTLHELPGFLFDPGSIFIAPLHLTFESFYGANLQFYVYFAILSGLFIFSMRKDIGFLEKTLVLSPIILQLLTNTIFLFGTYRYRAPITPFNMILLAFAVEAFFSARPIKRSVDEKESRIPAFSRTFNFYKKPGKPVIYSTVVAFAAALIIAGYVKHEPSHTGSKTKSSVTPWTAIHKTLNKLVHTHEATLNSTVFAYYRINEEKLSYHELFVSFDICRFLMPGVKPYYRLALDGQLIGEPTKIPAGCSTVSENIQPKFKKGLLNLFIYISDDGKTPDLKPSKLDISSSQPVTIPLFSNFSFTEEQARQIELFENFSRGYVKVNSPVLLKIPK